MQIKNGDAADHRPEQPFGYSEETFESDGTRCAARVYRPTTASRLLPVVVMAHGFGSVRALRLYSYAERFAAAGYAVVAFDYRGFGDSDGKPRQVLDISMQHDDWAAALAFGRSLPGIDANKIVAWGTSFGGGHVLTVAGRGESLAAVIAQVPHVSGPAAVRATGFPCLDQDRPHAIRDRLNALAGREPVYVPLVGRPGELAIMTTPDALEGMEQLMADSGLVEGDYRVDVAARIGLKIGMYSPKRVAARITCPTLIQIANNDAITPRNVAMDAAGRITNATVHTYDCGHFDPYVEPIFSSVIADQLAFLAEHVPVN